MELSTYDIQLTGKGMNELVFERAGKSHKIKKIECVRLKELQVSIAEFGDGSRTHVKYWDHISRKG